MLPVLLLALLAADTGRFERFCTRTAQGRTHRGFVCNIDAGLGPPYFELAPDAGTGMGTECACSAITGTTGEAITVTRTGAAECPSNDGQALTLCSNNNEPRVSSGVVSGVSVGTLGVWSEPAATNLVVRGRDLSDAAWVAVDMTCTLTATGMRGGANTASTCTADANNGQVTQALVVAAAARSTSMRLKRRTGTGTVEVTRNGGATWSAVTLNGTWKWIVPEHMPGCQGACVKVAAMTSAIANPEVGIRLGTSGDAVDVDFVQDEAGDVATTPIETAAASASRNAELVTGPNIPIAGAGCMRITVVLSSAPGGFIGTAGTSHGLLSLGAAANRLYVENVAKVTSSVNIATGGVYTVSGFWSAGGTSITVNATTDTGTGAVVVTPQTLRIGNAFGAGSPSMVAKLMAYDTTTTRCTQ